MVSQARPKRHARLKAPAKIRWSSRIALALKHPQLKSADSAVLVGLFAVVGPRGLDLVLVRLHESQAIATDAAAGAVEAVGGIEVALPGCSVELAEAVSETINGT